jgi:DNA primase
VAIPQNFIQELLTRVDIVEVVGRYVQLKKGGANFMGLCPFHGEKSPSFSVSPTKQFFHCFGCGKSGNAVGFLMDHTGIGFVEAVKDLAQQVGLQVPEEDLPPQERARAAAQRQRQSTLNDVLLKAAQAYQTQLRNTPKAVDYLKRRGLTGQIAKTFGLGYVPEGWRFLSTVFPDYQSGLLVEAGLVIASDADAAPDTGQQGKRYDRFRDRIMFPIRNVKGDCIGFGGRVIDQGEPKYLNSPETPVFSKGHELYGLFEARTAIRQAGYVLVTEGYMDVVALAQLGFPQAVATLGTACTPDHVRLLFRFSDTVVFGFDGDAAGRRAARKALEATLPWATDTRTVKFLFLPTEHDPDSFVRAHGPQAFADAIQQATPLSRFLLDSAASGCELDTAEGRARMGSQAQPLWTALPDGTLKRQLLQELADGIGLDARELTQLWQPKGARPSLGSATAGWRQHAPRQSPPTGAASNRSSPLVQEPTEAAPLVSSRSSPALQPPKRPQRKRGLLGRGDRVARIVLSAPDAWDWLTHDDHHLLAQEPPPHGLLFAWLETQWLEHGPQPWAVLREAMRGLPFEGLALDLYGSALELERPDLQGNGNGNGNDGTEAHGPQVELRQLLRRMHIERLKQLETEWAAKATSDPAALDHYRTTQATRKGLEQADRPA